MTIGKKASDIPEQQNPQGGVNGGFDVGDQHPHGQHDTGEADGHDAEEVEHGGPKAFGAMDHITDHDGECHGNRRPDKRQDKTVANTVDGGVNVFGPPKK